jgi:glycosyltransferase involved in cell wall biosynthesis
MASLVSVIIPCRNGAAWLGEAVQSCLGQTWQDVEIVIVDDGSTDSSLDVARRYESPKVAVVARRHAGASAARNAGLAQARGDFIQFLDADDVLDRNKIGIQMERLARSPPLSLASGAWARFRDDPSEAAFSPEPVWRDLSASQFLVSSWAGGGMMPNFAWLTPRAVIEKAGPWNEELSVNDDGEFFGRAALASSGILFCDGARGYYRLSTAATLSRRRDRASLVSCFTSIELLCEHLLKHRHDAAAAGACATLYQRFAFDTYPDAMDLVAAAEQRVAAFGGSELKIGGGRAFQAISRALGWKAAKRCQRAWHVGRS